MRAHVLATILAVGVTLFPAGPGVTRAAFGTMPDGTPIEAFTIANMRGVEVRAIEFGAIIVSLRVPDRSGRSADVVLGYDTLAEYVAKNTPYLGGIVGRYANRIAKGRFTLDGQEYTLATNNPPNHLHGGVKGFDKVAWIGEPVTGADGPGVAFTYTSRDGEEGYPGTLKARVTYTLNDRNELIVDYHATSDKPTHVNLSQHSYFNLSGGDRNILDHQLTIDADRFTPVDETLIPTGDLAPVVGTPLDFRKPAAIGARINDKHVQLLRGRGYDHNFVLLKLKTSSELSHAARLVDPMSGRTLDIATTEPGMQFYSGNFLDGSIKGKKGRVYAQRWGLCLETQHFPDSPNRPDFPSTVLRPGAEYRSRTVFTFGVSR
ncbi:MAG: aldose epimerase family protein [Vicinamibacterales bacterium]